jgi:hypothetical protein
MRILPRSLTALAVCLLCLASGAAALPTTYTMTSAAQMSITNVACAPCTVPVTGTVTLDDGGSGSVSLTNMSLAHDPYQVALPSFVSIVLDRDSITLASGSVTGSGSTLSSVIFGSTSLANVGTVTCISGILTCQSVLGPPPGTYPLPSPFVVNLGTWLFDGLGGLTASFVFTSFGGENSATETLFIVASSAAVPEPGTGGLLALGAVGLALRARRTRSHAW